MKTQIISHNIVSHFHLALLPDPLARMHLANPFRNLTANGIIILPTFLHIITDNLPHFACVPSPRKIYMDDNPIDEEDDADAEYYG